jgi:two-component system nitrogen regulation response regulator NtrX
MVGESKAMARLREQIAMAAPTNGRVLISGENGTGKELVARHVHALSQRSAGPFIEVNCAALPEELIESELFGHVKGSFTGAVADRRGKFEAATGGTLFLDEVGDMSLKTQAKVLRALQEQVIEPVGGEGSVRVDVRVIAATNKTLTDEIRALRFREDLYFRLNVIPIFVPALRERGDDVLRLADHFVAEFAQEYGRRPKSLSPEAAEVLRVYGWPGNVRELRNVIERLMIMVPGDVILAGDLSFLEVAAGPAHGLDRVPVAPLFDARDAWERSYILGVLATFDGNISRTADALGLERSNLYKKMRSLGIGPVRERGDD